MTVDIAAAREPDNTLAQVDAVEIARRLIRRADYVSCRGAFIDSRLPGADLKDNYSIIGPGVSQSAAQVVNLVEPHGFNVGAAAMPHAVTNNLHLHFTAEVFLNFSGQWKFRWGQGGMDGELIVADGDIISVPTWLFRGFTNEGPDDGWLFTVLGGDNTGGIVWDPAIVRSAAADGLFLTTDHRLVDTKRGDQLPAGAQVMEPMTEKDALALVRVDSEDMERRAVSLESLRWSTTPYLCSQLPGGGARLAAVIGHATTEDRTQLPPLTNPHGFGVEWLEAEPEQGVLTHRHQHSEVLIVRDGSWKVTFNEGHNQVSTVLEPFDTLSVPVGAWRSFEALGDAPARMVRISGGDGRVLLQWSSSVKSAARNAGTVLDADGYVAPLSVVRLSTIDD